MTTIPDVYRYRVGRTDTLLYREVYDYFKDLGVLCAESEPSDFGASYPRTSRPIKYLDLNVHLNSEPRTRASLFTPAEGMIIEMTVVGTGIETKIAPVIEKFGLQLSERNWL